MGLVLLDMEPFALNPEASAWVLPCLASAPPPSGQAALQLFAVFFGFMVAHEAISLLRLAPGICGNEAGLHRLDAALLIRRARGLRFFSLSFFELLSRVLGRVRRRTPLALSSTVR